MNVRRLPSAYESPLRREQKAATRQRILDAAGRLMQQRGLEEFSYAAIAAEADVKERTVYRHFPSKQVLLEGLWGWYQKRIHYGAIARTEAELVAKPQQTFRGFDENEQLTRALWSTRQGREFRLSNVEDRKAGIKEAIAQATNGLAPKQAKWIAAVIHVLYSGAAWSTMKDYWGLSGGEAGKAAAMAMELLLNAVRENLPPASRYRRK
jgi:AcrR family transcriptional regulator